ncbi:non-ribosomal peptide synthetase [Rhodococcus rhodnii]|uniref:Non-ribosomal peptide synthetase n=2 Tax=Rhodococcus rhodnii TaxID=38312 RepID=R7WJY9_9NOCA|nr:non-ribosomal peptide synthetase [Rhodococcus rhodnii]EOM75622.1 non-ribosomal peptide synthetase [Rhodococcus rhodnii LMG 5362]TXG91861.1 non-ribosomal peptide synthetase [Rhodococcus rhodnii]
MQDVTSTDDAVRASGTVDVADVVTYPSCEYPVTAAQRGIWFGHQLDPTGRLYNIGIVTDTLGDIDAERLGRVSKLVLDQVDTLHVNVAMRDSDDGEPRLVQVPRTHRDWSPIVLDFRDHADPVAASDEWMRERMAVPFDLGEDQLFDFCVHRIGDRRVRLFQKYHHIVNDGYGFSLVVARIARAYTDPDGTDLDPGWTLPVFVGADESYRASTGRDEDRAYWLGELADLPAVPSLAALPGGSAAPGPLVPAPAVPFAPVVVDGARRELLDAHAREHGLRLSHVLVALTGAYVARATAMRDVVFSLPTTARGDRALRSFPCMVSNVVPLRLRVGETDRLADVAGEVELKIWKALRHGRFRGEEIGAAMAESHPDWRPPTIGINLLPNPTPRRAIGDETRADVLSWGPVGEFEFAIVLPRGADPIEFGFRAHPDHAETARTLVDGFPAFLDEVLLDLDGVLGGAGAVLGGAGEAEPLPHDDGGAGPLPILPALARARDTGHTGADRTARLVVPADADVDAVLAAVVDRHDVLRTAITAPVPGMWLLDVAPRGTVTAAGGEPDPFARRVLTAEPYTAAGGARGLALRGSSLLLDAPSWDTLVRDVHRGVATSLLRGEIGLPPVPRSLAAYAREITERAADPEVLALLGEWMRIAAPGAEFTDSAVPSSAPAHGTPLTVSFEVDGDLGCPEGIDLDVALAATLVALDRYQECAGGELLVDVWNGGRRGESARTLGPLGTTAPIRVARASSDPLGAVADARGAVDAATWPVLRHLAVQAGPALAALAVPQILVRDGGDRAGTYVLDVALAPGRRSTVVTLHSDHGLTESGLASIADFWEEAAGELAQSRGRLAARDVTHASLPQRDVDAVVAIAAESGAQVSDIWPLSPLQRGLLFQSSFDDRADIYTAQFALDFGSRVDVPRLRAAAQRVLDENPTLRAGFVTDGVREPVQFVATGVSVPFTEHDLTALPGDERDARLAELEEADRRTPFDLTRPPLWRMMLVHLRDEEGDGAAVDRLVVDREFILWDGWSGALFVDALLAHYAGDEVAAPEAQFTDYLAWLAERDEDAAARTWARMLDGIDEPTLLAGSVAGRAAVVPLRIESYVDEETVTRLRSRARTAGVTLNALMNAAMGLLTAAESGRTDVVFGSTVAGQPTEVTGLDRVMGMFLNTVPIRVTLRPHETTTALLRRMQDEYAERLDVEYLGLGEIQQAARHSELFDTLFVLQNFKDAKRMAQQSQRYGIVGESSLDHTHYPLAIVVSPGERLHVKIDYRPDLVERERAQALHDRFVAILGFLVADDPVVAAPTLTPAEYAAAAEQWRTPLPAVEDVTVAEMLAARAAVVPDDIALVAGEQSCTYGELTARIDALARRLLAAGSGPEALVCLGVPRSIDMVVALFAVLRTGAAYVPLELDQPDARLHTVIGDADPALFVVTDAVRDRLRLDPQRCLLPSGARETGGSPITGAELGRFAPGTRGRLDHPAYVIYTSGSTGRPKGVVTPYLGLTNMQRNHQDAIFDPVIAAAGGRRLRVAHTVSFAFDMSWEELLWLVEGHEVHVCDEDLRRDSAALVEYCDRHEIDVVNVTPTYATALFSDGLLEQDGTGHRPPLVLLGGEAVADSVWNRLRDTDGTLGYNLYGPTEYTINTLGGGTADSAEPTVGTPIRATRAHILDPWLRPVPDGVAGELYIAGVGLARGYLARPELTGERFVADPFTAEPGTRMYRTGDLVRRRRGSGLVDYLGRIDDQVKIRGYRVELHEIESVLEEHPDVRSAAVVALDDPLVPGTKRLAAYAVPNASDLDDAAVTQHLRERLPDYMVPGSLQQIAALPTTVNGKLDVKALPAPQVRAATGGRPPSTPAEHALAAIFTELLALDDDIALGADADFFELGGHSMIAMRVVSRVRAEFDVQITIRDLFEARTVAALAQRLGSAESARPAIAPRPRPERVPLSAAQERMWTLQQLSPAGSLPYHYPFVVELAGEVDAPALGAAVRDVLARHESLRTVVGTDGETAWQVVLDPDAAHDVRIAPDDADETQWLTGLLTEQFDLTAVAPLRVGLVCGEGRTVLAIVMHHIATDERSDAPLLRDLGHAYDARTRGEAPSWTPLPVQYADYTLWQQDLLDSGEFDRQLDWWETALRDLPEEMPLPLDRTRGTETTGRAHTIRRDVDPAVARHVRAAADARGASMFMALHAATAAALARLGAGTDVVVGTPVSGRADTALDELVGFFVETVVLRTDVSGDPTLGELVSRVKDADLAAMSHQDVPFQQIVERIAPPRVDGRNPLFQVMLGYLQRPQETPGVLGMTTQWQPLASAQAKFDLHLTYVDDPATGELALVTEYATDLFDAATIETVVDVVIRVLAAMADPALRVNDLEVVADRTAALRVGDGGPAPHAPLLTASLAAAAERHGDRIAVRCDESAWTYRALAEASARVAHALIARGVRPGDLVAVTARRSFEQIVAVHAIMRAGAAYLPVDTSAPAERVEFVLSDAAPVLVVDEDDVRAMLADGAAPVGLLPEPSPAHPLYVIYTSGSTGRPKGVVVNHAAVANRLAWVRDEVVLTPDDTMLLATPISFDVSVWELFWPFTEGASVVVTAPDAHRDPSALLAPLAHATHAHFVPSVLDEVLRAAASEPGRGAGAPGPRHIVCSGEALGAATVARAHAVWPGVRVDNLYGPTEAAVEVTLESNIVAAQGDTRAVPIGVAGARVRLLVLDAALRPVPHGVTGELYIGGVQVADGYLRRPGLTAERFVADPYGSGGQRLYRTGDLARWNSAGSLDFRGRVDDQVKLRGMRIELGEVAAFLADVPGVTGAAAAVHGDVLVGYVTGGTDPEAVRGTLAARVPGHLVPSIVLPLDEIPLSAHGKLDRRRLPVPEFAEAPQRAPATGREAELCALFGRVLDRDDVGPDDGFFALGGHSLSAVRLVNAVREQFGVTLSMRDVFDAPTPAALAHRVARGGTDVVAPVTRREHTGPAPVSFAQRRMWLLDQLGDTAGAYNVPISWRVPGGVDAAVLRAALADVARRHTALRTVFPAGPDGEPVQVVLDEPGIAVDEVALDAADDLGEMLRAAVRHRFDLRHDAPVHATVIHETTIHETNASVVVLVVHHIAIDEWSTGALIADVAAAYGARLAGEDPGFGSPAVEYVDYTLWQRELLGEAGAPTEFAAAQLEHWRGVLAGSPDEITLPLDRPRGARPSYRGATEPIVVPADVVRGLRELAAEHDVSMFMITTAAVSVLLQRFGAGDDIPIGTPVSGRTDPALEDLVGFFLNTLVVRTDLSGNPTIAEVLGRVRERALAAFEHQHVPFEQVVSACASPGRGAGVHPLFQVMVVYLTQPAPDMPGGAMPGGSPVPIAPETAKFDLSFDFVEFAGTDTVAGVLEYRTDLFDADTARRLTSAVVEVLREFAGAGRDHTLAGWGDVVPAERAELDVVATRPAVPGDHETLPDLFAAAAVRHGDRTAVIADDARLTFAELASRVHRWARELVARGVAPERTVALVLPRRADTITAILAVAAAGGAYVAVDPDAPAERRRTILDSVDPVVVLTDGTDTGTGELSLARLDAASRGRSDAPLTDADRRAPLRRDHPVYVVHTSGSTGTPKAVVATHRGLVSLYRSHREDLHVPTAVRAGRDRLVVGHAWSFFFDASWQPQLWLLGGHTLAVVDDELRRDPHRTVARAREQRWDFLEVTPSHLGQLLDAGLAAPGEHRPATLGFGGEAISPQLWERLRMLAPETESFNLYGPSESTVDALVARVTDADAPVAGRPVAGTTVRVLDDLLRPVPIGVVGELYLAGDGLARGYRGETGRTAGRFVAAPGGGRMYRTGDRVRWTPSGHLEFRGRGDDQLKIRGYRIEPGEIENALRAVDGVVDAVVLAHAGSLAAYVAAPEQLDRARLRGALARTLPAYMIPASFTMLTEFPTLPNGKIDRAALPDPVAHERPIVAPTTEAERTLCTVLSREAGVPVGIDDDLVSLGIDSIGVMRVVTALRERGFEIDAADLFTAESFAVLAAGAVTGWKRTITRNEGNR